MMFESYMACMENRATDEQQLIWKLGNVPHCVRIRLANGDMEEVNKILKAKAESKEVGVLATANEDVRSLRELITYGLKGLSAYSKHANALDYNNEDSFSIAFRIFCIIP